jgi:hypothetical protein
VLPVFPDVGGKVDFLLPFVTRVFGFLACIFQIKLTISLVAYLVCGLLLREKIISRRKKNLPYLDMVLPFVT